MDALSRLLSLYPLRTAVDVRCHFRSPWMLDNAAAAPGIAPYHLILTGTAWLDAGGKKGAKLQAGDIIVFPNGSAHQLHTEDAEHTTPLRDLPGPQVVPVKGNEGTGSVTDILCGQFVFGHGAANTLLGALPETILVRTKGRPDFAALRAVIEMLRIETELMQPAASMVVSQLSSVLFALLIRAWLEQANSVPGLFALLMEPRLQAVLQGVLAAPEKDWSLEKMAKACHTSRATFARLFRQVAGTTPAAILMQTRMAQAALWLAQGKRPVGEIGEAVGYQSEAAFNRAFKRHFGVGPGEYRRSARLQ
jgi:AraC family transcriptional activator of mtrCDE